MCGRSEIDVAHSRASWDLEIVSDISVNETSITASINEARKGVIVK